jgi:hypothetical protein
MRGWLLDHASAALKGMSMEERFVDKSKHQV